MPWTNDWSHGQKTAEERAKQDAHEKRAQALVVSIETMIIEAFHLGDAQASEVFKMRHKLVNELRTVLAEEYANGREAATKRIKELLAKAMQEATWL